jgi:hypothetical protein
MASIGQGVVSEAHCISLVEVAAEQMLEPIDIAPATAIFCKSHGSSGVVASTGTGTGTSTTSLYQNLGTPGIVC